MINVAVGADRNLIGAMNSEKKYRNKKMSGGDKSKSAKTLWRYGRKTGGQESK